MKRLLCLIITSILSMTLFLGCGKNKDNENIVNISILNSKFEIDASLKKAIENFNKENKNINIKVVKYINNGYYDDKLKSMYELDNAPTMTIIDPQFMDNYKDKSIDLSSEKWVNDIVGDISDIAKNDKGKLIAFPFSTEGVGLIYNKKVMESCSIDVSKINTRSALEEAFKKIEEKGKKALVITNEEWSLGDHFLATAYSVDKSKSNDSKGYFDKLRSGDLKNNDSINGIIDTFDLMKKYNMYSEKPLDPSYDKCAELIAKGEVGFWYMGNWASEKILSASSDNNDLGFIPVPISNNSSDYGNNELALGVTKYIVIDGKNSSKEQQEAAKKFLNYIVYDSKGNDFLVKDSGIIPAFKNIKTVPNDPLSKELISYRNNTKTMELMNGYLPSDNSKVIGGALRRYLNNEITREELLAAIEEFWKQN